MATATTRVSRFEEVRVARWLARRALTLEGVASRSGGDLGGDLGRDLGLAREGDLGELLAHAVDGGLVVLGCGQGGAQL